MSFDVLVVVWVLILARLSMVFVFMPVFSTQGIPTQIKVIFIGLLSFAFLSSGIYDASLIPTGSMDILISILFEMINGMTIGFAIVAIMNGVYIAGHMIDMNMGFSMVNVMSATDEDSLPVTANFYYILVLIMFLAINAHHMLIDAIALSLNKVPLGSLGFNLMHVKSYTELIVLTFEIGFRLCMPVLITVLVSDIVLGLLSKAMPGMNIFVVGMPFKILIGLFTLVLVFPAMKDALLDILEILGDFIYGVIGRMYL